MAGDNWMDDRERQMRERERRGASDYRSAYEEDRTWDADDRPDPYANRRGGRERVFGERETGASYGGRNAQAPRAGGSAAGGWQDSNYGGVSPAMRRGDYGRSPRFTREDYRDETIYGGGRFYGDDGAGHIYGQAGVDYDADYSPTRARYHAQGYGQPGYGGDGTYRSDYRRPASGGTGGYDYERGYGDGGRSEYERQARTRRFEEAGRSAGDFLHRAGERMASWFGGGGEARAVYDFEGGSPDRGRGARGLGPQGYKRADERINDDAHERLTDDPWLDASEISISVSGGEITLSGTVDSRDAKHRAERVVEDISGVTHVQNNLRISRGNYFTTASPGYGDSVLGAQIRLADEPSSGSNSSSTASSATRKT